MTSSWFPPVGGDQKCACFWGSKKVFRRAKSHCRRRQQRRVSLRLRTVDWGRRACRPRRAGGLGLGGSADEQSAVVAQSWDEDLAKGLEQMHQELGPIGWNTQRPQPQCDARAREQGPQDRHDHLKQRIRGHVLHTGLRTPETLVCPGRTPSEIQGIQIGLLRDVIATVNVASSAATRLFARTRNRLILGALLKNEWAMR